jgi:hypothetical protein
MTCVTPQESERKSHTILMHDNRILYCRNALLYAKYGRRWMLLSRIMPINSGAIDPPYYQSYY